jgi:hypothetical protein
VSDATVYSAFPIDGAQLADVVGRAREALQPQAQRHVVVEPVADSGGIRCGGR